MKNKTAARRVRRILAEVRRKYNVEGAFSESDFFRICEGEKIDVITSKGFR
jgi:hypothetical protein